MSARRRKPKKDITQPIQPKQLRVDSPEHSDPTPIAPESKNESTDLTSSVAVDLTSDKTNEIVEQPFKRNLRPRKQPIKMEKDFVSSDGGDKDDRYNNSASNNEVEDVKQTKKVKSKHTSKSKPKTKQVKKKKKKKQIKSENESSNNQENEEDQEEEQDQQIGPYHPLHHWSRKRIGFHLETGGDLSNPVKNCIGQSVALFLGSNRGWNCRQIKDDEIARFKSSSETRTLQQAEEIKKISKKDQKQEDSEEIEGSDLNPIPFSRLVLPHSTYLVNLATKDNSHFNQSVERLKMELSLSVRLGVGAVNFHPGSTKNELTREKGCERVAEGINKILSDIDVYDEDEDEEQEQVRSIRPCIIIENSAHHQTDKSGSIGSTFEDIAAIINSVDEKYKQPLSWRKKHKTRKAKKGEIEKDLEYPPRNIHDPIDPYGSAVGVCLDLAHLFGAGIDIRTESAWQQTLNDFDRIIGRRYLLAVHLNDSLGEFNSGKDLHAVPGKGLIGIESFRFVMNCSWFDDIPIIVETKEIGVKIIRWLEQLEKDPSEESPIQEKV